MLKILNDLEPFFMDNYRRINVREYSREIGISPPTASKLLHRLWKEGLLKIESEKNYIFYFTDKESREFIHLSRIYWLGILRKAGLIEYLEKELVNPVVILFGSFSKAEVSPNSDIDIAVFSFSKKNPSLSRFQTSLKRDISAHYYKKKEDVPKDLLNSILNGFLLSGSW